MNTERFAQAVAALIDDPGVCKIASRKDLIILEAMLTCVLDAVTEERELREAGMASDDAETANRN